MKTWIVKFAYSGSGRREFFEQIFEIPDGKNFDDVVSAYVKDQNKGEAKSDRIRLWSRKLLITRIEK